MTYSMANEYKYGYQPVPTMQFGLGGITPALFHLEWGLRSVHSAISPLTAESPVSDLNPAIRTSGMCSVMCA